MNAKRIVISGVVIWIVSSIFVFLTCGWLFNGFGPVVPGSSPGRGASMVVGKRRRNLLVDVRVVG